MNAIRFLFLSIGLLLATAAVAMQQLPNPRGDVVLTVTGPISNPNDGDAAVFDIEMLEALGAVEVRTSTIWTDGEQAFVGVRLSDILGTLGVTSGTLRATAVNDYSVEIPISDAVDGGPIIAFMRNGKPMSLRDKGPLWIIYPYDSDKKYQSEVIYSRSIWQLDRLEVMP